MKQLGSLQRIVTQVRWGVLGVVGLFVVLSRPLFGLSVDALLPLVLLIGVGALTWWLSRRLAKAETRELLTLFIVDQLLFVAILGLSGGAANPLSAVLLLSVACSALLLPIGAAWFLAALSALLFGALFHFYIPVPELEPHHHHGSMHTHLIGMWVAYTATASLLTLFLTRAGRAMRDAFALELQLGDARRREQQLALVASLAASAAHRLGSPLMSIALAAEELTEELRKRVALGELAADAELITTEVFRCQEVITTLAREGGSLPGESAQQFSLEKGLQKASESLRERLVIAIDAPPLLVSLPPVRFQEVVGNILKNALEAGAKILSISATADGEWLQVMFEDDGRGVAPEVLQRFGEPFLSTKSEGLGLGLGLFIARLFVEQHGGVLALSSRGGKTTVTMRFPMKLVSHERIAA